MLDGVAPEEKQLLKAYFKRMARILGFAALAAAENKRKGDKSRI